MSLIYLLDTNTISEPLRETPDRQVVEKIQRHDSDIALAAFVVYPIL